MMTRREAGWWGFRRPGRPRRRGAILLVVALVLLALIGIMALTLECGALMVSRRNAQAVADAAALAAGCDLSYNYGFNQGLDPQGTATAAALAAAAALGYANDGVNSTVVVNIPPTTGDYADTARYGYGYAEVLVTQSQSRSFSAIFGSGSLGVAARSVARGGPWKPTPIGLLALEPVLPATLTVALNGSLTVTNAAVDVNSSSLLSTALALNGRIAAPSVNLAGNYLSLLGGPISGTINTGVAPTLDPLAYLDPPDPATLPVRQSSLLTLALGSPVTLQPGVYRGGIRIAGFSNVTMQPGIYYMQGGGFTVADTATLRGTGVTIVNAPILPTDAITIAGSGSVQLTPPTSGLYAGITIMQPPALIPLPLSINPTTTIGANSLFGSSFSIGGTIYAPLSIVALAGNGTARVGSQVICRTAAVAANASVQINWDANTARTPTSVKLVE